MEENSQTVDIKSINEKIEKQSAFIDLLTLEINKVIVGQKHMIERLLIGLLGQGHILLEGVPGLAKTLAINTLSQAVSGSFSRIQFTPDRGVGRGGRSGGELHGHGEGGDPDFGPNGGHRHHRDARPAQRPQTAHRFDFPRRGLPPYPDRNERRLP